MSAEGFYFNVKQWLGDDAILLMDWDVRAMHLHLMCIAWQKNPPGALPADEAILRKWLSNPPLEDWLARIKPQLAQSWRIADGFWIQDGLSREFERQANTSQKRRAAANSRWGRTDAPSTAPAAAPAAQSPILSIEGDPILTPESGILLAGLLKESAALRESATQNERLSIWSLGVTALCHDGFKEDKARSYLGKLIQEHGEKIVAEAVASMSIKHISPADAKSYLAGILRTETTKRKRRGGVAL